MKLHKRYLLLGLALALSLVAGIVLETVYRYSERHAVDPHQISLQLQNQMRIADEFAAEILHMPELEIDLLNEETKQLPTSQAFYIANQEEMLYWNSNSFEIHPGQLEKDGKWHFIPLSNAYAVYRWVDILEGTGIVSVIPIKSRFPYENKYLQNEFSSPFHLHKDISLSADMLEGAQAIQDAEGNELFYLQCKGVKVDLYRQLAFYAFALVFILLIYLYSTLHFNNPSRKLSLKQFRWSTALLAAIVLPACYFDFPESLFSNRLFFAYQYAANELISSFTHLTIIAVSLLAAVHQYLQNTEKPYRRIWVSRTFLYLYLLFFFEIIKSLVIHSGISFNVLLLSDINFINLWAHLLLFIMGLALYFLMQIAFPLSSRWNWKRNVSTDLGMITLMSVLYFALAGEYWLYFVLFITVFTVFHYCWQYLLRGRLNFSIFGGYLFVLTVIVIFTTYQLNEDKKFEKYRILAENILLNGNTENDPIAELLLEELEMQLQSDDRLATMISHPDSVQLLGRYINNHHLRGFRNKYEVQTYLLIDNPVEYEKYMRFVQYSGRRLPQLNFYSLPTSLYDISYIGLIELTTTDNEPATLVMEFRPSRNFRSFSFPDLLISTESDLQSQLDISIAKYEKGRLIYTDMRLDWPMQDRYAHEEHKGFVRMMRDEKQYFVYSKSAFTIVITEMQQGGINQLMLYGMALFLFYLLIGKLLFWLYEMRNSKKNYRIGLTSKFQLVFTSLLFISFIGIFIFSVDFIRNRYEKGQIEDMESKKAYLQKSLQDMYFWTRDMNSVDVSSLNNNLQELAFTYHTDINVYDNRGMLIGSSQNLVFQKNLMSRLMSPDAFFSDNTNEYQYERIGGLNYLVSYTELLNGDFLQIGYIAIPRYLSQSEINAEIESFLSSIIQIYILIIVLSIILILIAGQQLAGPLRQLESKLKSMHWGAKNEKIDYKWQDEIGQLVKQYNRTVDELEKSTRLLLQSERETAWRTMARQVAHEINNPLTPMKLTIQQLQRTKQLNPEGFDEYFVKGTRTLIEQIDNLARIAGTFSQFARLPDTKFSRVDLPQRLISVVDLFSNNHEKIKISYEGPESDVFVFGDAEQLIQVFNNLLKNATQAIGTAKEGKINVALLIEDEKVIVRISDNGSGIPDDIAQDIFRPSFTTKSTGMGLGLSITKNIIENMEGSIAFTSEADTGTTFEIRLKQLTEN